MPTAHDAPASLPDEDVTQASLSIDEVRLRRHARWHGLADLLFATLYGWLGFVVVPGRSLAWNLALGGVTALLATAGAALFFRRRWALPLAVVAQAVLLACCAVVVLLLVASAAYLHGIYGSIGRGMALVGAVAVALVVELCGLLPIVQLRFLLRAEVRRALADPRRG